MTPLEIWGWVCGAVGAASAFPQLRKLLSDGSSAGLSLLAWQLNLGSLLAWTAHGLIVGRLNLILTNFVLSCSMAAIVILIIVDRGLAWFASIIPAVGVLLLLVGIELSFGDLVFGLVVLAPGATAWLAQLKDILQRSDISGVSLGTLIMNVLLQYMWVSWSFFAGDRAVLVVANVLGLIALLNLIGYVGRRTGQIRQRVPG